MLAILLLARLFIILSMEGAKKRDVSQNDQLVEFVGYFRGVFVTTDSVYWH